MKPVNVDILTSLHVRYSLDLIDKTTAAKQRSAKGNRFDSFHIDALSEDSLVVINSGFVDDEDDEGDEQWGDKL